MRALWGLACWSMVACAPAPGATAPSPGARETAIARTVALEILPVTSTVAPSLEPPRWSPGDVLKHMPARCERGRAYANLDELLAGGGTQALAKLAQSKLPLNEDGDRMRAIVAAFEESGANPYAALKEVAFCFDKSDRASVAALRIDLSKIDKPSEVLIKSLTKRGGAPRKVETAAGLTWVEDREGNVIAIGEDLVLFGNSREAVESGAGRNVGASGFAGATNSLAWVRLDDGSATLTVVGDDLDVELDVLLGPAAANAMASWQILVPQLDKLLESPKLAALRPLLPAAKRAKVSIAGDRAQVSSRMAKAVVREVLQGLADGPGPGLEGGF
jgi:hypothetical protein